ncbi:hypothetical protein BJV74DRAFT_864884 [Russula compacta]|nr:hypothetical protein BJV74DRAFT_864884 [Russula compacta]
MQRRGFAIFGTRAPMYAIHPCGSKVRSTSSGSIPNVPGVTRRQRGPVPHNSVISKGGPAHCYSPRRLSTNDAFM